MKQKKNLLRNMLSYITYKEKKEVREFVIPQTNPEEDEETKKKAAGKSGKKKIPEYEEAGDRPIPKTIQENLDYIKHKFNVPDNKDLVIREFTIANKYKAFIAFLEGMADGSTINNSILKAVMENDFKFSNENKNEECLLDFIMSNILQTNQVNKIDNFDELLYEILSGNTVLYVDGCDYYVSSETKGFAKRGVEKPEVEGVVLGSHEAFNETLRTNITLIRKQIRNNNLTTEYIKVGNVNKQLCAIMYIKGLTNPAIINEVKRRIKSIKTDMVIGDGILEQFIEDSPYSLVPTIQTTERPDRAASYILEGKVAILMDGAPFAKIVPTTFFALMQSPEDAFMRWPYGSLLRISRYIAATIALLLPSMYVALTNFHHEMIPTELLIAIAKAKENVPFPTIVEVLLMEFSFELIREAGIRIPGIIGNTLGIIGALILGQAAVQANIVSPVLIIVVAVTGLGNFAIPNYSLALSARLVRFLFIVLGALLGFYGITLGIALMLVLLFNTKSFGVPYFAPISPKTYKSNDLILRQPAWDQEKRPDYVNPLKDRRQPRVSRKWTEEDALDEFEEEQNDD